MEAKTPKKRGRKPVVIDVERVEHLASQGLGVMDITRALGVGWDVFNRHREKKSTGIAEALDKGKSKGLAFVTSKLMETIEDKNFNAISFYLRNRAPDDWNDKQVVDHQLNLSDVLASARERLVSPQENVIEHQASASLPIKEAFNQDGDSERKRKRAPIKGSK
tara:strand:+ start:287 stop:778 length:492 start_codon:yes stop_codon:yes gene_type:complete